MIQKKSKEYSIEKAISPKLLILTLTSIILMLTLSASSFALVNVTVEKTTNNGPFFYDDIFEFIINITNVGDENITDIFFEDTYNLSEMEFVYSNCNSSIYDETPGDGIFEIDLLYPDEGGSGCFWGGDNILKIGESYIIYMNFTHNFNLSDEEFDLVLPISTLNYVEVIADNHSFNVSNNVTLTMIGDNITIVKTLLTPSPQNGSIVQFMINITNFDHENLTNYNVMDSYNTTYLNYSGSNQPTSELNYTLGEVAWDFNVSVNQSFVILVNFTALTNGTTINNIHVDDSAFVTMGETNESVVISAVAAATTPQFNGALTHNGTDNFYYDGETAYFFFNASNIYNGSDGNITINCTELGGNNSNLVVNITGNKIENTYYMGSCVINYTLVNVTNSPCSTKQFMPLTGGNVSLIATISNGTQYYLDMSGVAIPFNFTVPLSASYQFGALTTNLATVQDFTSVDYVLEINNLTGSKKLALLNFSALDMSNQLICVQFDALGQSIDIEINDSATENSSIYLNSSALTDFNTTTTLILYGLPYSILPSVTSPDGGTVNSGFNITYDGENLTFKVDHFTTYVVYPDITLPYFTQTVPISAYNEYKTSFSYDVNATDSVAFDSFALNDTSNFSIVAATGIITNNTLVAIGIYTLNITINDTTNNENWTIITINVSDTVAPTWAETPTNQTVDTGVDFSYDVNATDADTITYAINDAGNFSINSSNGNITNNTALSGTLSLQINATDASGNVLTTTIAVTVADIGAPTWLQSPTNQVVTYNTPFAYDVNATDNVAVDTYSVNNSDFTINQSGYITNNTLLSMGVHSILITVNDTSGNSNSTAITVTVPDSIMPYFIQTVPISAYNEYKTPFSYDVNATDSVAFDSFTLNDTSNFVIVTGTGIITNNTLVAIGIYTLNITINDTTNNENWTIITINVSDTVAPTWSETPTAQSVELGADFSYDVNATDADTITYIINDTGNFAVVGASGVITNNTALSIGAYSLQINATDTTGNDVSTTITITVADTIAPALGAVANQEVNYSVAFGYDVTATDLTTVGYSVDNSDFAINTSGYISNNTLLTIGTHTIIVTANDTSGNEDTATFNVTVELYSNQSVTANTSTEFDLSEADTNLTLYLNNNVTTTVIVTLEIATPSGTTASLIGVKAVNITLDAATEGNLTWALLKIYYTDAEITGIDESALRLYYYNGTDWELEASQGVETASNYVWANLTHFSLFGIFGSSSSTPTPPSGGGGGGGVCTPDWQCGEWSICTNGKQTRTCTDRWSCNKLTGKPEETQSCTITEEPIVPVVISEEQEGVEEVTPEEQLETVDQQAEPNIFVRIWMAIVNFFKNLFS